MRDRGAGSPLSGVGRVSLSSGRSDEGTGRTMHLNTDGLERQVRSLYGSDGGTQPEHRGDEFDRTGFYIPGRIDA